MKMIFKTLRTLNLFLLATITLISCKDSKRVHTQNNAEVIYTTDSSTIRFEGIITNVINDCWADGICSIEVNDKWWIVITEGLGDPSLIPKERGKVIGIRFTKDNESLGKKVAVYAKIKENNQLSIEGNSAYHVQVLETKILK